MSTPAIATAHTSSQLVTIAARTYGAHARTVSRNGVDWVVIPIIAMVGDAVVCPVSSGVNEFVPTSALSSNLFAWSGRPVTLDHPGAGTPDYGSLMANTPAVIDEIGIGYLYNPIVSASRLKMEAWIDTSRAASVVGCQDVIDRAQAGEIVELSLGAIVTVVERAGTYNGVAYEIEWEEIEPDHVAMLPFGVGACSVAIGCGGPRNMSASVATTSAATGTSSSAVRGIVMRVVTSSSADHDDSLTTIVCAALATARRPTYNGTESVAWSSPTFADYAKGLHNGSDTPPISVAKSSAALKSAIAARTLLGDPNADNFRDLSFFPVVDPRNDKLNERALRAVLGGRGSQAKIPADALKSAQDMARSLLNSEFDAKLTSASTPQEIDMDETVVTSTTQPVTNTSTSVLGRMSAALANMIRNLAKPSTTGTSYGDMSDAIGDALRKVEPSFSFVSDIYPDTSTVVYATYGNSSNDYASVYYQRTYAIDAGTASLTSDRQQIEVVVSYKPVAASTSPTTATTHTQAHAHAHAHTPECQCKGAAMNKAASINRLIAAASAPFKETDRASLTAMSDAQVGALDVAFPEVVAAPGAVVTPSAAVAPAATPPPVQVAATDPAATPAIPGAAAQPQVAQAAGLTPMTRDEFLAFAPPEILADLAHARQLAARIEAQETTERGRLISTLSKIPQVTRVHPVASLALMPLDRLRDTAALVGGRIDYSGLGMPVDDASHVASAADGADQIPEPPKPYTAALAKMRQAAAATTANPADQLYN